MIDRSSRVVSAGSRHGGLRGPSARARRRVAPRPCPQPLSRRGRVQPHRPVRCARPPLTPARPHWRP